MSSDQNFNTNIVHVAFVVDESYSMLPLSRKVVQVVDEQTAALAERSRQLGMEVRVSVIAFGSRPRVLVSEKDVFRLPSIKNDYRPAGRTALLDAVWLGLDDLALQPEKYGKHSFLVYAFTDGQENNSRVRPSAMSQRLANLPDNWTVAVFVPDKEGEYDAKEYGFPENNIAHWDATSTAGVEAAGSKVRETTNTFLTNVSSGVYRGTKNLFGVGDTNVNAKSVAATLDELQEGTDYVILHCDEREEIRSWIHAQGYEYTIGRALYQWTKTESIQPQKAAYFRSRKDGKLYGGSKARELAGFPQLEIRTKPDKNSEFDTFIQSTSVNRKLVPGTDVLLILK